jgi:glucosamine--fructose-6-phosphate aminotransferase (isomerizing)
VLAQGDQALPGIRDLLSDLAGREVRLITAGVKQSGALNLPFISAHPAVEPLLRIQSFYRLANALSVQLGLDPDQPPHLEKVTATY